MCTPVSAGGNLTRPTPRPPPRLKRVEVERNGWNRNTASGLNCQLVSEPGAAGFVTLNTSAGTIDSESLSQYLMATVLLGAMRVFAPATTPTPNPSDPVMSSAALAAVIACIGGGTAV